MVRENIKRPRKERVMIPANINPNYEIPENDKEAHWFRGCKILVFPNDPMNPQKYPRNFCVRECDFDRYLKYATEQQKSRFWNAGNWHEVEWIHDGSKETDPNKVDPTADEMRATERKHKVDRKLLKLGLTKEDLK